MPEGRCLRHRENRPREKTPCTAARSSFDKEKEKLSSAVPLEMHKSCELLGSDNAYGQTTCKQGWPPIGKSRASVVLMARVPARATTHGQAHYKGDSSWLGRLQGRPLAARNTTRLVACRDNRLRVGCL
ncbi:hypothetical protein B296_00046976 [Ensete ventricosum]|uniref:Uncharacterized protein n=1 Tax=Ensete ventricosum TaxID=4639 RepID=A0A426XTQ5_ENSVE|nr:hypothetical protein B296_00046976 [Ensete ventricosum]